VDYRVVFQVTCRIWGFRLTEEVKGVWKRRARILNRPRIPGEFVVLPRVVAGHSVRELNNNVMHSLILEWDEFQKQMRQSLTRKTKWTDSGKHCYFGHERVEIRRQVYRSIFLSFPLWQVIFGNMLDKLQEREVMKRGRKQLYCALLHLPE